jgi:uncharacterized protein (DUF1810 family)
MNENEYNLQRFIDAQETEYATALSEIRSGGKRSHWIWYIFPQQKGLGHSCNSEYYGLDGTGEARAYLAHPCSERDCAKCLPHCSSTKAAPQYEDLWAHKSTC